ncbi:DUF1778 domain-containing protein [Mesorhizobium sp. NZP2077]|uniref:type II toxin-antitoxin system TacA family antitoxin n=1 Tax=Mesorhizobium sp. NZP2077 TaxID=2483404 RepID=UPI001FEF1D6B|nr:DUF1778 domain-containing protein [Mesorhizobium sp. NZP2077]
MCNDLVLEALQRATEDTLLNRVMFTVEPDIYAAFLERLDAPQDPNHRLRRTMTTKPPWDAA